ncbi:MAG TPA: hypothetical protein VJA19_10730 [Pseudomonas sp.]|nr:hypothetical protein [Pseudomonas sp.]
MKVFLLAVLLPGLLGTAALAAESQPRQPIIERVYISPGASGSIGTSSRYESHDLYGGQRLPYSSGQDSSISSQGSFRVQGNLIQGVDERGMGNGRPYSVPRQP